MAERSFFDEIGELPKPVQVKLLRTLQEGEVTPVGSSDAKKVDVRVVAATNRTLINEVASGNFREDLFIAWPSPSSSCPPLLRERAGDLSLLIDALLKQVNEASAPVGVKPKKNFCRRKESSAPSPVAGQHPRTAEHASACCRMVRR